MPVMMPPNPDTGILTAFATCHTMRSATGLMAGPANPHVIFPRIGRLVLTSMASPKSVLTRDSESAPASSTAFAIVTISVTFGDSFTITGRFVLSLMALVTAAACLGSVPKATPPSLTFGQEILTSSASTPSTVSIFAHSAYSSVVFPTILAMKGTPSFLTLGR